jgi:hypothetical protein
MRYGEITEEEKEDRELGLKTDGRLYRARDAKLLVTGRV